MGRKKNGNTSLLSFIFFPRKRTKVEMSRRHLFSLLSLSFIISQSHACPAGHIFIEWKTQTKQPCHYQDAFFFFFFFLALVEFYWHKSIKIKILLTIFSEPCKLSRDSGPYLWIHKTIPRREIWRCCHLGDPPEAGEEGVGRPCVCTPLRLWRLSSFCSWNLVVRMSGPLCYVKADLA